MIPIPSHVKRAVWDYVRPYKDNRYFFRDFPGFPAIAKPLVRGSVDLEAITKFIFGRDPEAG